MNRSTVFVIVKRNMRYYILFFVIVLALFLNSNTIQNVVNIIKISPLNNKVIVIDPGHGGIDGGTNIGEILEKDINLTIGLKLKELLMKKGATVIMSREIDESLDDRIIGNGSRHREDLEARVQIVNESSADLLISIHVNHIKNKNKIGPIIFYQTDNEKGKYLAEHMQEYLNDISTYKKMDIEVKHGATSGNYYILGNTLPPGIIVELGFISNEIDRELLLQDEHQNEIVEQITKGIIYYFNKVSE